MEYNGHKNWETWVVRLHCDEFFYDETEELLENNPKMPPEDLATYLRESTDTMLSEGANNPGGLLGDIISGVLSDVDWTTIANDNRDAVREQWQ